MPLLTPTNHGLAYDKDGKVSFETLETLYFGECPDTGRQAEVKLTTFLALRMCELIITTVLHLSTTGKRGL